MSAAVPFLVALLGFGPVPPPLPRLASGEFPEALRERVATAYRRAEQEPLSAAAAGELGMLLHAYEQLAAAESAYARAAALEPAAFDWVYLRGVVLLRMGRNVEAADALRAAAARDPAAVAPRVRLGEALLGAGDAAGATTVYEALLKAHPDLAQAQYGLGRAEAARGRLPQAVEHYEAACRFFETYAAARYALGLAYRDLGKVAEAQRELAIHQQHLMDTPPLEDAVLERVRLLKSGATERLAEAVRLGRAGDVEGSVREHAQALALDPTLVQAHVNLISLYGRLGRWTEAEEQYRAAVALAPGRAEAHYDFGVVLNAQGRLREAAEAFRKALAINPRFAAAHNNLGTMLEADGHLAEAEEHYRQAVADEAGYRLARFNLGRVLVAQGRPREAAEELEKILTPEDAETPRYLYALAAAWIRAGERDKGVAHAREALRKAEALGQTQLADSIDRDLHRLESPAPPPR